MIKLDIKLRNFKIIKSSKTLNSNLLLINNIVCF